MPDEGIPIEFGTIRNDALFFGALQYLPCCIFGKGGPNGDGHSSADLALLPQGFQLATSIFQVEDKFAVNGWTAIPNLGKGQLSQVIEAYSAVGLPRRAEALRRVLNTYLASPADENEAEDCHSVAAQGELPDLLDDEDGCAVVLSGPMACVPPPVNYYQDRTV